MALPGESTDSRVQSQSDANRAASVVAHTAPHRPPALALCVVPAVESTLRFDLIGTRDMETQNFAQLAEIKLWDCNGKQIPVVEGSAVKNLVGGASGGNEIPLMAFDDNLATKWLGRSHHVGLQWKVAVPLRSIKSYSFVTANDDNRRDPANWVLRGNDCGCEWKVLHNAYEKDKYMAPLLRLTETDSWDLAGSCDSKEPKKCNPSTGAFSHCARSLAALCLAPL